MRTRPLLCALSWAVVLSAPGATAASAQDAPDPQDPTAEIMAVVDAALERISAEDMVGFTDLMIEGAVIASVGGAGEGGEPVARTRTRAEERIRTFDADLVERGFDAEVKVSGPMAMVWLPYDFYRDGEWSHCGIDVFTLVRTGAGWRIATATYTVEQPPACRPHPDGPPGEGLDPRTV